MGQTNRPLSVRFTEHYRAVRNKSASSAVGEHFAKKHPTVDVSVVENILCVSILARADNFTDRLYKEALLIRDLCPEINRDQGWEM